MIKRRLVLLFISSFLLISQYSQAQTSPKLQNLSNVEVDDLSDAQIQAYIEKAKANGLTIEQFESAALARGMSKVQVEKLKARIAQLKNNPVQKEGTNQPSGRQYNFGKDGGAASDRRGNINKAYVDGALFTADTASTVYDNVFGTFKKNIFGASLFNNEKLSFEPDLKLPTPKNYQIGPGDELQIDIYGLSEANYTLPVSSEGSIRIPLVSPIYVSGSTIEQAQQLIEKRLAQIYSGINDGSTNVKVSLGNIRSIKVTIMGEAVMPGTYTLPSLATVFNALYSCGGPSESGSYRDIQLIRGNKVVAKLDVYDFLMRGDQKNNIRLEDQDLIRIGPYNKRISVFGEVKNPAYFEALDKETFKDILNYAGGFTERAYTERVKVLKNDKKEKSIDDILESEFSSYIPQSGDRYIVEQILNKYSNRVIVKGAVFREGPFELEEGLMLSELIKKADGARGDAFLDRGYIKRTRDDYTTEIIAFNLKNILNGVDSDIKLVKDDEINIPSLVDLKERYSIKVEGEVLHAGEIPYSDNMTLEDAIIIAGGLKDAASLNRLEIARRIREGKDNTEIKAEIYTFDLKGNLARDSKESKFLLKPFDIVSVRRSPLYIPQEKITIDGEVMYPGVYTLSLKKAHISALISRAGGLTPEAYAQGAILIRQSEASQAQKELATEKLKKITENSGDSVQVDVKELTSKKEYVGIQLDKILKSPGSKYDLLLQDGDVLKVPRTLETVRVAGEALYPVSISYTKGKRALFYIKQSGGFTENAKKSNLFVVNANGSVTSTKKILFFNKYPKVNPGSEIIIPQKANEKGASTQEKLAITSTIASLSIVMLTAITILKK